jgi:hypothetical protein
MSGDLREAIRPIVLRREQGRLDFIDNACTLGGLAHVEAEAVFDVYLRAKLLRWDGSRYVVTHGACWDRAQLRHSAGVMP